MLSLDYSFDDAGHNLALDEVLLNHANATGEEALRFWESPSHFVVLGLTQQYRKEVEVERCKEDSVPIRRRCSAGGCVVQGPGSLNYTLVLSKERDPDIASIQGSYRYIFNKIIQELNLEGLSKQGVSDIALGDVKISGNAQRRQKDFILHHGTLLYNADLELMSTYIQEPDDRPDYRGERTHTSFIRNLPLSRLEMVNSITRAFESKAPITTLDESLLKQTRELADKKYNSDIWNYRK